MKKYLPLTFLIISVAFILAFAGFIVRDIYIYNTTLNSAPFYIFIIVRVVEFIVPAVIFYIISRVLKKRFN